MTSIDANYIKRLAYNFLLREGVTSLPVNAQHILKKRHYYLLPYTKVHMDMTPKELTMAYGDAFVYPTGYDPIPYGLGINMECTQVERNWTIMHELAHIELGHVTELTCASGFLSAERWAEEEVELFCLYAMCPDVVLKELNIRLAVDILAKCYVPYRKAVDKENQLKKFRLLKSIKTPTEQAILHNFKSYIDRENSLDIYKWEFSSELCL